MPCTYIFVAYLNVTLRNKSSFTLTQLIDGISFLCFINKWKYFHLIFLLNLVLFSCKCEIIFWFITEWQYSNILSIIIHGVSFVLSKPLNHQVQLKLTVITLWYLAWLIHNLPFLITQPRYSLQKEIHNQHYLFKHFAT